MTATITNAAQLYRTLSCIIPESVPEGEPPLELPQRPLHALSSPSTH